MEGEERRGPERKTRYGMRDASEVRTHKLYYDDAYIREFDAEVLSFDAERGDLVLKETAFFPEEGGQSADTGEIGGIRVMDVQIRDGEIHHFLDPEAIRRGTAGAAAGPEGQSAPDLRAFGRGKTVHGILDWDRRFSNMQQHSAEHIVSGLVHSLYGYENVGFHLSDREVTLDFSGILSADDLLRTERAANGAVWNNIASEIRMTTREERENLEYRSKLDLMGNVRIVTYPGYDACACCAPHVRRTGEIGLIKLTGAVRYKGGVRVSILAGGRALALFEHDHDIVTRTAEYLTTSPDEIYPSVVRVKEENRRLAASVKEAAERALLSEAGKLDPDSENVCLFTEGADMNAARAAVSAMMKAHPGFCAVFSGNDRDGYTFVIGSRTGDARKLCGVLREKLGARGGGKPAMAQGSVRASEKAVRELMP